MTELSLRGPTAGTDQATHPQSPGRAVGAGEGTVALGAAERVDFARMRRERRDRCLDAMRREELDVLVLAGEANVRYASGARRPWTASARPFGPRCIVSGPDRSVHLLTTWADGVPAEIPFDNFYGLTWNPASMLASLERIEALRDARRIGVDGTSLGVRRLLARLAPNAEIVDATRTLEDVRRVKTPDEAACLRTAVAVAEACLVASTAALRPGVTGRELAGRFVARLGDFGLTTSVSEGTFGAAPRHRGPGVMRPRFRHGLGDDPIFSAELVVLASGVLYEGYQGEAARTLPCLARGESPRSEHVDLARRWSASLDAMLEQCRPGATAEEVASGYTAGGEKPPPFPVVQGLGLGTEPPFAGGNVPSGALSSTRPVEPGMVLALQGYPWEEGVGGLRATEVVLVTENGCERMSRLGHGPLWREERH